MLIQSNVEVKFHCLAIKVIDTAPHMQHHSLLDRIQQRNLLDYRLRISK